MTKPLHILICGEIGVGKSTLIRKLLAHNARALSGFLTKRLPEDVDGVSPVCIYPADTKEFIYIPENQVGTCTNRHAKSNPEVFNTVGLSFLNPEPNQLILMDEIGFMESMSDAFCEKILSLLDGSIPILAAVKTKDTPFLEKIRSHKNASLYLITEDNRDVLYQEILPKIYSLNHV